MPLIVFEGPDESGKTTQATLLYNRLLRSGIRSILLREPGSTPLGEKLRDILLSETISSTVAALLFSASRRHMMETVVSPALRSGTTVILDRFYYSQLAYQEGIEEYINVTLCGLSSMYVLIDDRIQNLKVGLFPVTDAVKHNSSVHGSPGRPSLVERYEEIFQQNGFFHPTGNTIEEIAEQIYHQFLLTLGGYYK